MFQLMDLVLDFLKRCADEYKHTNFWSKIGAYDIHLSIHLSINLCIFFKDLVQTAADLLEHCEDEHKHCGFWAEIGECDKNPEYMLQSCRESCDECDMPLDGMTGIYQFYETKSICQENFQKRLRAWLHGKRQGAA